MNRVSTCILPFAHEKSRFDTRSAGHRHPTQKPLDLCEWLIKTYSNESDTILDPFMGSGSTGHGCVNLNRHFIGCETHALYFDMATKRIATAQLDLINQFGEVA